MDNAEEPKLNKYLDAFQKHLTEVDELSQIVLKGHLIIESALDNIIEIIFFHPEHILEKRFAFLQKVAVCRSLCLRRDRETTWDVIEAVNAVRNEVAHRLDRAKFKPKMDRLRELYRKEGYPAHVEGEDVSDQAIVLYACSGCTGFLGTFEHDIKALRTYIDELDLVLNGPAN